MFHLQASDALNLNVSYILSGPDSCVRSPSDAVLYDGDINVAGIYNCLPWSLVFDADQLSYFPDSTLDELGNKCR